MSLGISLKESVRQARIAGRQTFPNVVCVPGTGAGYLMPHHHSSAVAIARECCTAEDHRRRIPAAVLP
jgi:hypothetical protein